MTSEFKYEHIKSPLDFTQRTRSNSERIYDALYEIKGDHEKVKNQFIKCFDIAVYTKIKKQYDIKLFFKYLKDKNHSSWRQLLARVNTIIVNNTPNYEQEIDAILDLVDDERTNYSIDTILKFCKKILPPPVYEVLDKNLKRAGVRTIDDMNRIFLAITGRTYEYFLDRYDIYTEKKYLQYLFDKWKAPKFTINPANIAAPPVFTPSVVLGTSIDDDRLNKLNKTIQQVKDAALTRDNQVLERLYPGEDTGPLFSFWENNMYNFIKKKNLRPRDRPFILAGTVWVFLKTYKNYKGPLSDFIPDPKEQHDVKKLYNQLDPRFFEIKEDYGKLIDAIIQLTNGKLEPNVYDIIRNELSIQKPTSVKKKTEIIYGIIKPFKSIKITRNQIIETVTNLE